MRDGAEPLTAEDLAAIRKAAERDFDGHLVIRLLDEYESAEARLAELISDGVRLVIAEGPLYPVPPVGVE